jgi:hypothetical protein
MNYSRTIRMYRLLTICVLSAAVLVLPRLVRAECKEYKIVEYEDRVEAVCVGEPPTEAQIKADLEEQKKQDRETHRLRVEEQNRQREAARASKAAEDAAAAAAAARKQREQPPIAPQQAPDRNRINAPKMQ